MKTLLKTIGTAAIVLLLAAPAFSQTQVAKSIPNSTSPDGLIGFLEFKPSDYGTQKHPLIVFLHGIGERGNGTTQLSSVATNGTPNYCAHGATMRFTVGGQTSSFVVLTPQLSTQYGYWPTFYVKEMIKYAKANLSIDTNRIYVTGLSLGGGGIWRLITDTQNFDHTFDGTIAAAAPVCGTQEETDADFCTTIGTNHLPVWAFHCMDDGTVAVGATQHAEILGNICGNFSPAMKFTYYQSGGHGGAWINAYDTGHITRVVADGSNFTANPNLYEWFLAHSRSGTTAVNTPPTAAAGSAQTITLPSSSVTLSGTGTGTSGATISSYAWTKTSGPASGTIVSAGSASTSVTGLGQGVYVFTLTVTDNHGLTASSTVSITVNAAVATAAPNQYPTANAGSNQTITLPGTLTLDASASSDPDGTIVTYRWTETAGPVGPVMATRDAKTTAVTGLLAGNYTFVLEVIDNGGLQAYATVNITVNGVSTAPNQAPIANAGANRVVTLPAALTLDASSSSDPDGSIVTYRWTQTAGPVGPAMTTRDSKTTAVTGLVAGVYTFVLQVIDNGGLQAYTSVVITVNSATSTGSLLGYVKQSVGPYQACDDASTTGRIAVYGTSISNGGILYADAAKTIVYNGGWNWYSFTPTLGGATAYAFAIYPSGNIGLLRNCATGTYMRTMADSSKLTTDEQDIAMLQHLKDSAYAANALTSTKLTLYPNPVQSTATIEFNSTDNGVKTIAVYNTAGVLKARYAWQTVTGHNSYQLRDVSSFGSGLYIIDIRDTSGKSVGTIKFLKM